MWNLYISLTIICSTEIFILKVILSEVQRNLEFGNYTSWMNRLGRTSWHLINYWNKKNLAAMTVRKNYSNINSYLIKTMKNFEHCKYRLSGSVFLRACARVHIFVYECEILYCKQSYLRIVEIMRKYDCLQHIIASPYRNMFNHMIRW